MSDPVENGRDFCMKNMEHCERCKQRACNGEGLKFENPLSCVKCMPSDKDNCRTIDNSTAAVECARTASGYKNACYTYQDGQSATRGCLYEAPDSIFDICKANSSTLCSICNQTNCNRGPTKTVNATSYILNAIISQQKPLYDQQIHVNGENKPLHCFKCSGTEECNYISADSKPTKCPLSVEYDECFTFMHHKG